MNKSLLYTLLGLLAVAIAAGAALYFFRPAAVTTLSLKDLVAQGGSQKCTFASAENGVDSSGTIHIAAGRMRGDFLSKLPGGQTTHSHLITDGQTAYLWTDQASQGVKMSFGMMGKQPGQPQGSLDTDQLQSYHCGSWTEEAAMFALPPGVTFAELNLATGNGTSTNSALCVRCEAISDLTARAQCRAALNCN